MNFEQISSLNPALQSYSSHELGLLILQAEQAALRMQQKFGGYDSREDDLRLIAAEVGMKALLNFDESKGASLKSWVVSRLRYAFIEYNRGSKAQFGKRMTLSIDDELSSFEGVDSSDSPYESLVGDNMIAAFGRAFGPRMMEVIKAKHDGLSHWETAEQLGLEMREVNRTLMTFQDWFNETF